jgi:uncharacterized membrane protein
MLHEDWALLPVAIVKTLIDMVVIVAAIVGTLLLGFYILGIL